MSVAPPRTLLGTALYPAGLDAVATIAPELTARGVQVEPFHSLAETLERHCPDGLPPTIPTVLFLDPANFDRAWENDAIRLRHFMRRTVGVVLVSPEGAAFPERQDGAILDAIAAPLSAPAALRICRNAFRQLALEIDRQQLKRELGRRTRVIRDAAEIGIMLSAERDLRTLLDTVLSKARAITQADGGSIYLLEGDANESMRFVFAQNDSVSFPFQEFTMPVDTASIAGYVAVTKEIVNLADVYTLPDDAPYAFGKQWDKQSGYRSQSILTVPMVNHDGDVIGCLQLINRKLDPRLRLDGPEAVERYVIAFDENCEEMIRSFASQAAVAIDNSRLIASIERLFEGMVTAATVAIESRDPTTAGHSERVATLSVALARRVSELGTGQFAGVTFSTEQLRELRYAGLLHDFGKVGVREKVLVKAKKLYEHDLSLLEQRFEYVAKAAEAERLRAVLPELRRLVTESPADVAAFDAIVAAMERTLGEDLERLRQYLAEIREANEPSVLAGGSFESLARIAAERYRDLEGREHALLRDEELHSLSIPKGSLNTEERLEIESHVTHTYTFLKTIPWTKELRDVPAIAAAHHEKLNGDGYPRKLLEGEIPVQSKIMAVADIFDALTASDRPYKKAVSVELALDILGYEVKDKHLDAELVALFTGAKVFEAVIVA